MIDKQLYQTPNAIMRTLAAPSTGTSDLAVWTVEMRAGQAGPLHTADQEQVWVILEGALTINGVEHASAAVVPAGVERRVEATTDAKAIVASRAPVTVATTEGERPLPWAA